LPIHLLFFGLKHPELGLKSPFILLLRLLYFLLNFLQLSHEDVSLGLVLEDLGLDSADDQLEAVKAHGILDLDVTLPVFVGGAPSVNQVPDLELLFSLKGKFSSIPGQSEKVQLVVIQRWETLVRTLVCLGSRKLLCQVHIGVSQDLCLGRLE
jgi:hypothetical protein